MENSNQENAREEKPANRKVIWVVLAVIIVIALAVGAIFSLTKTDNEPAGQKENTGDEPKQLSWQEGGIAVSGEWADAEVVKISEDKYRMYYSVEPEVTGNKLEMYSAVSTDGKEWTKEEGTRRTMSTFPDVIKLADGSWRMYFQNSGVVKSAKSSDGLTWTDEPGVRVGKDETGYSIENVGASSTTILSDGSYIMVYRGMINKPYETTEKIPNSNTQIYFWATSKDGLTFEKKGLAIDSRNDTLYGLADGGEWIDWDNSTENTMDDELRVSFWSYTGVYHSVYKDGAFSSPVFDWTNSANEDKLIKFAPNPPGDPTYSRINGTWFMYYGQHTKGIYWASLK